MDEVFLSARITYFKTLAVAIEAALLALSSSQTTSYTLSTGQTSQTVTKANVSGLRSQLEYAYNMIDYFNTKLNGGAMVHIR